MEQNFSNHRQWVTGFHIVLSVLLLGGLVGSAINIYRHIQFEALLSCILIALIFVCMLLMAWYVRQFPIKAQDRAIRAEESLRYYILTGKPLSHELTIGQIAALRFASDEEFVTLAYQALADNMQPDDIKKAIATWRADHHRV